MFVEDLPEDFDYQRILDENDEIRSFLHSLIGFGQCQQNEKGEWVTIRQLTGKDLDRITQLLDRVND